MKTLVYTAIFGNKDEAPRIIRKEGVDLNDFRFVCVTDNPNLSSPDYEIVVVKPEYTDVTKNARKVKVNGVGNMGEYDSAIWHDSSLQLYAERLTQLIALAMEDGFSTFRHGRNCIYKEAIACIEKKKDHPIRIVIQMIWYFFIQHIPSNSGLYETTILAYNTKTYHGSEFQKTWWKQIRFWSRRDQLSIVPAARKTGFKISLIPGQGHFNEFGKYVGHMYYNYVDKSPLRKLNSSFINKFSLAILYRIQKLAHDKKK